MYKIDYIHNIIYNRIEVMEMPSTMCFYISKDGGVYRRPVPNSDSYKPFISLANQEILMALIHSETINRKPTRVDLISFDRLKLDSKGGFKYNRKEMKDRSYNFVHFGFVDEKELSKREEIPIPKAPVVPSREELDNLYKYINDKYPMLSKSLKICINEHIESVKKHHEELKRMVKKAYALKGKKSTTRVLSSKTKIKTNKL